MPGGSVTGQLTKPLGYGNELTTVVVQLAGDPITVADANSANGLTDGQRASIRSQLQSQQAPVESAVRQHGGQILASYQAAYNGFKVEINASQAASLASLPGVVAVHPLELAKPANIHGVPLIGGPQVWDGLNGFHGEGIKIADLDTGIDYTHADFGGPGTVAAYQQALSMDTADPTLTSVCMTAALTPCFGPNAPKVKGGIDLVGDSYNADPSSPSYQPTPQPDPNPLDCNNHGTHTAGTLAGFGVLGTGKTYTGSYNASTISSNNWLVGPGVAPKADLYAVRIFGCQGSTNEVIDGIEWAVDNHMDVINMSLGAPFGSADSPDAVAAENAAHDGIIVVAASGNEGGSAYITSSPASGDDVIAAAANDGTQSFPAAQMGLSTGSSATAINANGFTPLPSGALHVMVLSDGAGGINDGCLASEYPAGGVPPNTLVVVRRGGPSVDGTPCARVHKAIVGQQEGAAAVAMVNSAGGYPPYEGPITSDPNTGQQVVVTIPFLGLPGDTNNPPAASTDGGKVFAADGGTTTLTSATLSNPGFEALASFSSWGPRTGDSYLKPNVTAPGVSVFSAGMGTGVGALVDSGTSMATPMTAGEAALVKQAHPSWRKVKYWDAAIENTADPSMVAGYTAAGAGSGFIQALPAVQTQVVALGDHDMGVLNYGFNELTRDYNDIDVVHLTNFGNSWATFTIADSLDAGAPHSVSIFPSSVSVPPRGQRDVAVRLSVPAATAGGASQPGLTAFNDLSGDLVFTPQSGSNNGVTLRVPYYMVPQAVSNIDTKIDDRKINKTNTATALTTNFRGAATGTADWYDWGIKDKHDHRLGSDDLEAAGVSAFPGVGDQNAGVLQFAISTNHRWSNATQDVFDVLVDANNDGVPDYDIEAADLGALQGQDFNGIDVVGVYDLHSGSGILDYFADAPTDSNTIVMPVDMSLLCDSAAYCVSTSGHFTYSVLATSLTDDTQDTSDMSATFSPGSPAVSNGMFDVIPPNGSATETLTVNPAAQLATPALGWMVVSHENKSREEAQLIPLSSSYGSHH